MLLKRIYIYIYKYVLVSPFHIVIVFTLTWHAEITTLLDTAADLEAFLGYILGRGFRPVRSKDGRRFAVETTNPCRRRPPHHLHEVEWYRVYC
jgi:hypothetical protein